MDVMKMISKINNMTMKIITIQIQIVMRNIADIIKNNIENLIIIEVVMNENKLIIYYLILLLI